LTRNFGDSIANLVPDGAVDICSHGLEQLLADHSGLVLGEGEEEVDIVSSFRLARLRGDSAEDDSGEGANLLGGKKRWSAEFRAVGGREEKVTYGSIRSCLNLLSEAHQQDLRSGVGPVVLEVLLGLRSGVVLGRLQGLQELGQLCVDVGGQNRHGCDLL
jgi:hypothetical protein